MEKVKNTDVTKEVLITPEDDYIQIKFSEITTKVPEFPGLYEIYTNDGLPLKVGISKNLKERLLQHFFSRQSGLKLKEGGSWLIPQDVKSKRSTLAKHLYFWKQVSHYDLTTQGGRHQFLEEHCYIRFIVINSEEAKKREKALELEGRFKFVGNVYQVE